MTLRALAMGAPVDDDELLLAVDELLDLADFILQDGRPVYSADYLAASSLRKGLQDLERELRSRRDRCQS